MCDAAAPSKPQCLKNVVFLLFLMAPALVFATVKTL